MRTSPLQRWLAVGLVLAIVLAAIVLLVALNVGGLRDRLRGSPASPRIESLAVLPLENLSGDPLQEFFADGMTEQLITELGQISALRVISRTSVMHYKGTQETVPQIARELHVDAVVEGSIERSGDLVRVTAQLIEAPTDRHLWARSYEREARNALILQDEVARAIASEIQVKLTPQEQARLASARPVNPEAQDLYLRGRYYWNKRTPETLKKSLEYFQQAIEKDPSYALGYAGLADAYAMLGAGDYAVLPPKEAYPKAEAAATKALELDSTLAEAHTTLAWVKFGFDWDWRGAEQEYLRAIELNPSYANAHHWYASSLGAMRRYSEAIAEDRKAESLDPLSLVISKDVAIEALMPAGQYDEAMKQCRKTLEMDPNFAGAHECLAGVYAHRGMYEQAIAEGRKWVELSGNSPPAVAGLGVTYAVAGRRDEATKILDELKARSKREFVAADAFAIIYTALGDRDRAFVWFQKAFEERSDVMPMLYGDPDLASLRSDPRFRDLLRRIGLPP